MTNKKRTVTPTRKWTVQVLLRRSKWQIDKQIVKKTIKEILNCLDCKHIPPSIREVGILLTDDKEIQKLNRDYRHKDKATDVLSFSQNESTEGDVTSQSLGDIVISVETARMQAKQYGESLGNELLRLIIHSLLHLLGYEHEKVSQKKAQKMRRLEAKVYKSFCGKSRLIRPSRTAKS